MIADEPVDRVSAQVNEVCVTFAAMDLALSRATTVAPNSSSLSRTQVCHFTFKIAQMCSSCILDTYFKYF